MPSLSNSYKQYGSGKVCRLTYLTDCFKHIDAVQDLPAEPSRYPLLCRSLVSTFSRKTLQGISAVFSSGRLLDLSQSNSLVILSLRYLIYIHRLSNLRTLSLAPNYLIRMLRTICSKLFGICYRLAREGRYRPTLDCGAKTFADYLSCYRIQAFPINKEFRNPERP